MEIYLKITNWLKSHFRILRISKFKSEGGYFVLAGTIAIIFTLLTVGWFRLAKQHDKLITMITFLF